ncbi:hypothetical protein HanHA300_Chr09g0317981 [Helianthus annuus]|nr:hypothetical protein HanHA300_Chr09g0317981 [Helianthus annuus]KAJ0542364.1 hypothetical protein HanHA89_Chr09g0338951 [Helianthus annuus]KAJ0707408.1 hypothetical protein HanLR1_Chr09g0318121 [Helianthus annuus]
MRNRHIIKHNIKILSSTNQTIPNQSRHMRPLRQQLISIKLSNNSFQNLISNRRKHLLIIF